MMEKRRMYKEEKIERKMKKREIEMKKKRVKKK